MEDLIASATGPEVPLDVQSQSLMKPVNIKLAPRVASLDSARLRVTVPVLYAGTDDGRS
jgi:hypothetical protein